MARGLGEYVHFRKKMYSVQGIGRGWQTHRSAAATQNIREIYKTRKDILNRLQAQNPQINKEKIEQLSA